MIFSETCLNGSFVIDIESHKDARGFFARTWCFREYQANGLNPKIAQCSISFNKKKGTLRGMHLQIAPHQETKLVRCTRGAIYDVIIDLRKNSNTYKEYFGIQLSTENRKMLYVPEDFAHGFITLEDNTEVFYQISELYMPDYARGVRWNDPTFNIDWPLNPCVMNERDRNYPDYTESSLV